MIILVCGSRTWTDRDAIRAAIGPYGPDRHRIGMRQPDVEVIHGAASRKVRGREQSADMLADAVARELGLPVRQFPADWERHGRRAGILRNLAMLDERPDLVMAFQVGRSRGTQHTIDEALRRGIRVELHRRAA